MISYVIRKKKGAYEEEIINLGGKIYRSPGLNPLKWTKYQNMVKKILLDNPEIKIVHSHNGAFALQSQIAAKKCNIKNRIAHAHGTKIDINYKLPLKLIYKRFIKFYSNYFWGCGREAIEYYFGRNIIKQNEYKIIKNAIEINRFIYNEEKREKVRRKYNLENKFVIGNVGRFMKQKNHEFILKLFKNVLEQNPDSVLVLIGDGELLDIIKNKSQKLNIQNHVIFMGNIENVNEIYQAMDVFLLPSIFEGLPVVGIEAQTAGLKCIMSDTISREVAITKNVEFLNLKKDSIERWTEEILKNICYERKDMSKEIIEAGYSIEEETKKLQEIYLKMGED